MNGMKGFFIFIFLTSLTCPLGYFIQVFLQGDEIKSRVVEGLRLAANRLETTLTPQHIRKDSQFNIYNPQYAASRSLKNRRREYLKICGRYSDPMRPESSSQEPKIESMQGFFTHGLVLCNTKHSGSGRKIDNMIFQSGIPKYFNDDMFRKDFPGSLSRLKHHGILVRHPMERLVSVYRDEFEESLNAATGEQTPASMSFPDFIELVVHGPELLKEYKRKMSAKGESTVVNLGLVDGKGVSSHWASYWNQCGLCSESFDPKYIVHLETFREDFKIINEEVMDGNQKIESLLKIEDEKSLNRPSSDPEIIESYYSQLSKRTIEGIYDKYRADHQLFGYTPDYFLQFGK